MQCEQNRAKMQKSERLNANVSPAVFFFGWNEYIPQTTVN